MGKLLWGLPIIYAAISIGSLAILGFPFLSGFYSKDLIIELAYSRYCINTIYIYILAILAAMFTASYSLKVIFYIFFANSNFNYIIYKFWNVNLSEHTDKMIFSIYSLIILSIISGYIFSDMFIGYGSIFWNNSIYIGINNIYFIDIEYINPLIKNLPIILSLSIMLILYYSLNNIFFFFLNNKNLYNKFLKIYYNIAPFFYYALFFNKIYNKMYNIIIKSSYVIFIKYIDKGLLEILGPFGVYIITKKINNIIMNSVKPYIFFYIYIFFLNLSLILFLIIFINYINIYILLNNLFILGLIIIIFYL
jgi:NADH-ubiquinone oxidoreductase chain 5